MDEDEHHEGHRDTVDAQGHEPGSGALVHPLPRDQLHDVTLPITDDPLHAVVEIGLYPSQLVGGVLQDGTASWRGVPRTDGTFCCGIGLGAHQRGQTGLDGDTHLVGLRRRTPDRTDDAVAQP